MRDELAVSSIGFLSLPRDEPWPARIQVLVRAYALTAMYAAGAQRERNFDA
jgi:hypothetical protein